MTQRINVTSPLVLGADNMAGAFATACATVIVWALNKYANAEINTEVAMAIGGIVYFWVAHLVPSTPALVAAAEDPSAGKIVKELTK